MMLAAGASKEAPFLIEADAPSDSREEAQPYVYPPHLDGLRTHGDEVDVDSILAVAALAVLSAAQLSLPPHLVPLLIWLNIPFILGSTLPQVLQNFQQGHTGQLAISTCFMKFGGKDEA